MQLLVGRCGFEDATIPAPGKSAWGMDTLTRRLRGHITNLNGYIAGLAQGQGYAAGGGIFYLQSWEPDEQSPIASITLTYMGLLSGTPPPDIRNEVVRTSGQTSASFADENNGLGRLYAKDLIYEFADGVPDNFSTTYKGYRDRYAVSATAEFTYDAMQTTYRYVSVGPPPGPTYRSVQGYFDSTLSKVRITTSDGQLLGRSFLTSLELTPAAQERVVSHSSQQVFGSPYYLCEDVVRKELVDTDV